MHQSAASSESTEYPDPLIAADSFFKYAPVAIDVTEGFEVLDRVTQQLITLRAR